MKRSSLFKIRNTLKWIIVLCATASQPFIVHFRQTQTFLLNKHTSRQKVHCQQIGLGGNRCVMPSAPGGCYFGDTNAAGQVQDRMSGLLWLFLALAVFLPWSTWINAHFVPQPGTGEHVYFQSPCVLWPSQLISAWILSEENFRTKKIGKGQISRRRMQCDNSNFWVSRLRIFQRGLLSDTLEHLSSKKQA